MMREILFKGKRIEVCEWVEGYLMQIYSLDRFFIGKWKNIGGEADVGDELFSSYIEIDPKTVGQFTGLLDKNGKKIFKGDVVNTKGYINGVVEYRLGSYMICNGSFCTDIHKLIINKWKIEIVGNIHDNKFKS